ncbi:hypothetical protein LLG95_12520 [bacterium]|nr:hypothetical protein [bacterium]
MFKRMDSLSICAILALSLLLSSMLRGQESTSASAQDPGWPRVFEKGDQRVELYQPQIDAWNDYRNIQFRCALAVTMAKDQQPAYGVIEIKADTRVDPDTRMVLFDNIEADIRFPSLPDADASAARALVIDALPKRQNIEVSLDRIMAYMDASQVAEREVKVDLDPPKIFYSDKPAILLLFQGQPQFKPIPDTRVMFCVNANWDVLLNTADTQYYLLNGQSWLTAPDPMKGPWKAVDKLPDEFQAIPAGDDWKDVRANIPGKPAETVPAVFASDKPAEIIVTDGAPKYTPIPGTQLMYVSNTDAPLFLCNTDGKHYFLVAGRWFSSQAVTGPWESATKTLPAEFAKIPADSPMAYVLASVPKTDAAEDAVLLASVPHKATVSRKDTTLDVDYQGDPQFATIKGTNVKCAVNTEDDVFQVNATYYCCKDGVWFMANNPNGPWMVCDNVPPEIYSIPPDFPKYNDTYVYVYDSTPDTVEVGYTGGYTGEYVCDGLLVYGAGLAAGYALARDWYDNWDDDWNIYYPYAWYRPCFSYGRGAIYHPYWGGYYAGWGAIRGPHGGAAWAYGPYRGAARAAYYNPATGTYARAAHRWGPAGSATAFAAYNPRTDTAALHAGASNIYGSWGRTAVARDDEWLRAGHRTTPAGTTGWVQTSKGGEAIGTTRGVNKFAAKTGEGDVYAGRDGNVYRREDGQWQKWDDGGWQPVNPPPKAGQGERIQPQAGVRADAAQQARETGVRPGQVTQPRGTGTRPENRVMSEAPRPSQARAVEPSREIQAGAGSDLNYDYQARQWGNYRANEYQRARSSSQPAQSYRPPTRSNYSRPSSSGYSRPSSGVSRSGGGGRGRR